MESAARLMVLTGIAIALAGAALWAATRLGLGRLPGDVVIDRGNIHIAMPIVTSIVISIILTIVLNVAIRLWR